MIESLVKDLAWVMRHLAVDKVSSIGISSRSLKCLPGSLIGGEEEGLMFGSQLQSMPDGQVQKGKFSKQSTF